MGLGHNSTRSCRYHSNLHKASVDPFSTHLCAFTEDRNGLVARIFRHVLEMCSPDFHCLMSMQVFSPEIRCPSMRKLGILGEEGRWFCGVSTFLDVPGCIIYIISSDGPLAFIRELVSATKCELHVFDPSITDQKKTWLKRLYNRIYFYNYTLGAAEATLVNFDGDNGVEEVQQKPLMDVMRSLGHSWLDALSANVDMDTWGWISAAHPSSLPITQTILRVDHGGQIKGFVQMLGSLMEGGFRIFNVDLSLQHSEPLDTIVVSFAKINQNGAISLRAATNFAQDTK